MRDQDHGGTARLEPADGIDQRRLAGLVQAGVRLVKHDQARLPEHRARESDPLPLTAGKHGAMRAPISVA